MPTPPTTPPQLSLDYGYTEEPKRTNGAAVASIILGFIGCIPFIAGLAAIALGIFGVRKSRDRSVGGKGLAIVGLVLGAISVVGWTSATAILSYSYLESKPAAKTARQFLQDVSTGDIASAMSNSLLGQAQIQAQHDQMNPFGALQSVKILWFNFRAFKGQSEMHLGGDANFANGTKTCNFSLIKVNGNYKVVSYLIQ
jgi:hypothetical protein